ncbi:DHA2 family efflux MFS transporter permease subunit [Clostridium sp. SHJSY1]|uniref:DHA2 family efflux MFS transporter permease subunit n=1 Tax=Clostridium sp. SHJSY1 TaxID=2942483 RepID=UPI0028766D2A|nr:DHA2 family efflux MFS transporter permease subunit [Clostridium sp. SHJSY1]MDS0526011.1 DHA2 family efflux MFS transporter permease subunit [Clostridium sp. SHJSY1]
MNSTIQNNMKKLQDKESQFNLIIAIVSIAILSFMGILSETGLNICYAVLMNEFNVSASLIQWLTTGYLLTLAILIPISPVLLKNFRTKRLFQTACTIFIVGTLFCTFSWNFSILLLGRIIQAVGTSIALPLMTNIILEQAPSEQRGYLMGIVGLVISFAPAMGPVFGGIIIELINWHWIFIIMIPFLGGSFILGSKYIIDINLNEKMTLDFFSIFFSAIAFGGIVYGFSTSGDTGWSDLKVIFSIGIGILSMVAFVYRQLNLKNPLIHVSIFKYPMFSVGVAIVMISMMTVLAAGFLLPLLLQKSLKFSSLIAALAMLPGAIMNGIMSPITGKILDKYGPKILLSTGFLLLTSTLIVFSFINNTFIIIIITYTIFMFAASMLAMPAQTNGLNQLPRQYNADGSAIMNTLQQVSGAIGTALASSILTNRSEVYLHQFSNVTPDIIAQSVAVGTHKTFIFFLIISFIGFVMALFTKR